MHTGIFENVFGASAGAMAPIGKKSKIYMGPYMGNISCKNEKDLAKTIGALGFLINCLQTALHTYIHTYTHTRTHTHTENSSKPVS